MGAYARQFLKAADRDEPSIDDGRSLCLSDIRKVLRHGPTAPGSLAKRASDGVDDAQISKMLMTSIERRENGTDALDAVRKIHARGPDGSGLALPEVRKSNPGARLVTALELEAMVRKLRNLRKDARRPALIDGLPAQSSNATNTTADPARVGATSSDDGWRDEAWRDQRTTQVPPPHSASMSRPSRSMVDAPLRADPTADEDDADKAGPLDITVKAIRAEHRKGPRRGW